MDEFSTKGFERCLTCGADFTPEYLQAKIDATGGRYAKLLSSKPNSWTQHLLDNPTHVMAYSSDARSDLDLRSQAEKLYQELIPYADHAECSVSQCYPEAWKLIQMFGIKRDPKDVDSR